MTSQPGQILRTSALGQFLTTQSSVSKTIVEIGTWFGNGSTLCIHDGLIRPDQMLITFEVDGEKAAHAAAIYAADARVRCIHGTIVLPDEFQPFAGPRNLAEFYEGEKAGNNTAPYRWDVIPEKIDLLVLDGGDWTSEVEFAKLMDRTDIVVLDDTNPHRCNKNVKNAQFIRHNKEWDVLDDRPDYRNGILVAKRAHMLQTATH